MVIRTDSADGKRNPLKILRRFRSIFAEPDDIALAVQIGYFIWTIAKKLEHVDLPTLLKELRTSPRLLGSDPVSNARRIISIRQAWLRTPVLNGRNTCYVRALTLYRFIHPGKGVLRIHFGVEPKVAPNDRLRGHAWVTIDGILLEAPTPVLEGRVSQIYCYPEGYGIG
jgi:Transglutaminase-like superfamily